MTARTCAVCGVALTRRPKEPAWKYRRRLCCGRACAAIQSGRTQIEQHGGDDRYLIACQHCGRKFRVNTSSGNWRTRKYCTYACSLAARTPKSRTCPVCGESFRPKHNGVSEQKCCSRACANRARVIDLDPDETLTPTARARLAASIAAAMDELEARRKLSAVAYWVARLPHTPHDDVRWYRQHYPRLWQLVGGRGA